MNNSILSSCEGFSENHVSVSSQHPGVLAEINRFYGTILFSMTAAPFQKLSYCIVFSPGCQAVFVFCPALLRCPVRDSVVSIRFSALPVNGFVAFCFSIFSIEKNKRALLGQLAYRLLLF